MTSERDIPEGDLLAEWAAHRQVPRPRGRGRRGPPAGGIRFAFYGRMSTEDYQDRVSSSRWQRDFANELVSAHGTIVAEYFDIGYSRRLAWTDRPEAAALLAALASPDRGFDAIVVGEYERAFYGDQFVQMAPLFERHGVQVWLPEIDGPVDFHNQTHVALMMLLGVQSKREVLRSRFRVMAAMRAQAQEQGRHLGGRPPYGYQLVDAGPHPNRIHASWGRQLHRLEPDPSTAPHVRWMFAQRLAGRSFAGIARALNENGIACPSSADPERNRHRRGDAWTLQTVAAILANPRYTGRQIWNRQRTDRDQRDQADLTDDLPSCNEVQRWNPAQQWAISKKIAHTSLVSEQDFVAAQAIRAARPSEDGIGRTYLLAGLLRCGLCLRRMDAHWVHGRPGYRCRHGHDSAKISPPGGFKNLYLREDRIFAMISNQVHELSRQDQTTHPATSHGPRTVAEFLRSNHLMITSTGNTWTLEAVDEREQAAPAAATQATEPKRPAREKRERVSVG